MTVDNGKIPIRSPRRPERVKPELLARIRQAGPRAWYRKVRTLLALLPFVPAVLLVRVLRPVKLIRFGPLRSDRIGHFALNTEIYLCERDTGMHGRRTLDLHYHGTLVSNQQLKRMWERTLRVFPLARALDKTNSLLPGGALHHLSVSSNNGRDVHGLMYTSEPHLSFTPAEELSGYQALRTLGVQEGKPFVCMLARDNRYLSTLFPEQDWRYHDYRNMDVQAFLPAAENLAGLGYTVFRMGSDTAQPLPTANSMVVDYARHHRTEFLDIFLSAKCNFFITSGTGLDGVAEIFRRPIIWVNLVPFENFHTWSPNDLFICKKHWLTEQNRFMTFREILDSGAGRFNRTEQYEDLGIEIIDNSPEEITALVTEMHLRLSGTWQSSADAEELQQRFRSLLETSDRHGEIRSRMGSDFLSQNREMLD